MLTAEKPIINPNPVDIKDSKYTNLKSGIAFDVKNHKDINLDKLSKEQGETQAPKENFIRKALNNSIINKVLSLGNLLAVLTDRIPSPDFLKNFTDKVSFNSTRLVMLSRYLDSARAAFQKKRIVESLGRIMGVIALPLVKLNDLSLASGLAEFIPQLDLALEGKIKEKNDLKKNNLEGNEDSAQKSEETVWHNANIWLNSLIEAYKEIVEGGLGKNRKIFPDFNLSQIKKMFTNSLKIIAGDEPEEIENKDQGHTLVFAGTLTFLGSFLGLMFARKSRDLANKVFGSIRSLGAIIADYTLLMHPDKNMNKAGLVTTLVTLVDGIQRFLPEKYINTANHLNLINSTFSSQIISNRSHEKNANNITVYHDDN